LTAGSAVLGISVLLGFATSWTVMSSWMQLIWSLVAFGGLLFAYLRANHRSDTVGEQLGEFWRSLTHSQQPPSENKVVRPYGATLRGFGGVMAPLKEHRDLALQQQIDLLSDYIRETVIDHITKAFAGLVKLDSRIDEARVFAEQKAAEAYEKATSVARRWKAI
jgi:hypothetical protein